MKSNLFQQICDEWSNKEPSEQQYEPFFRAVSAVAHSTGTKLRTRVQLLNQVKSLLIFHKNNILLKEYDFLIQCQIYLL